MKFKKDQFKTILEGLKPGLAQKNLADNLANFSFSGKRVYTYNDQIFISHVLETDFQCSVSGDKFYSIVANSPGDELDITLSNNEMIIKGAKSKAKMTLATGDPDLDKIQVPYEEKGWATLPEGFTEGLELCCLSLSRDLTKPAFTCVAINDSDLLSTDRVRISRYLMGGSFSDKKFLIPGTSAKVLTKYPIIEYLKGNGWIHFRTGGQAVISSRLFNDTFPDVNAFFELKGKEIALPKRLKEMVDSVSSIIESKFEADKFLSVLISGKEKTITCSGQGDTNSFVRFESLEAGIQEDLSFDINPVFLSKILDSDTSMIVGESKALFLKDNFEHVVSLSNKK